MEILGIGPMELILVLIIAMMVFGPDKLPEMGARLGKAMKSMRQATREFSREIEATREAIESPLREIGDPLKEVGTTLKEGATAVQAMAAPLANPDASIHAAMTQEVARLDQIGATEEQVRRDSANGAGSSSEASVTAGDPAWALAASKLGPSTNGTSNGAAAAAKSGDTTGQPTEEPAQATEQPGEAAADRTASTAEPIDGTPYADISTADAAASRNGTGQAVAADGVAHAETEDALAWAGSEADTENSELPTLPALEE